MCLSIGMKFYLWQLKDLKDAVMSSGEEAVFGGGIMTRLLLDEDVVASSMVVVVMVVVPFVGDANGLSGRLCSKL